LSLLCLNCGLENFKWIQILIFLLRSSLVRFMKNKTDFFFFIGNLVLVSWQAFISSLCMKLDFISLPSSKSTLPFAWLQHMQQCNARLISTRFLLPCFDPNEWCIKNVLHSVGLNPRPFSNESSGLNCHEGLCIWTRWFSNLNQELSSILWKFL